MERVSPELIKILVHITAAVNIDHGLKFEAIVEFDFTIFYYFFFSFILTKLTVFPQISREAAEVCAEALENVSSR